MKDYMNVRREARSNYIENWLKDYVNARREARRNYTENFTHFEEKNSKPDF